MMMMMVLVLLMMLLIIMMLDDNDDHAYDDDDDDDDDDDAIKEINLTPDPNSVCNNAVDCKLCLILCIIVYFFRFSCVISLTISRR